MKGTAIKQVKQTAWTNDEMQHWDVRHYTSKFTLILGEEVYKGIFEVGDVRPPPFQELLSAIAVATLPGSAAAAAVSFGGGDSLMMSFTSGNAASGHTSGLDWSNVGNVGDTFYGLFYKGKPATGLTPSFISDAVYRCVWSAEEFGSGWASADWLGKADQSQALDEVNPDDDQDYSLPKGVARQGALTDIIADIFPDGATRDLAGKKETDEVIHEREQRFQFMGNFEVKKHGPMTVK